MRMPDMELIKEKIVMTIAAFAAAIILLMLVYIIFFLPLMGKLRTKYSESRHLEGQAQQAGALIDSAGKTFGKRTMMTEKDVAVAIDELTEHGKAMQINFHSIRPKDIVMDKDAQYKILPIEIELDARYEQLSNFIGSLDELKKSLIRVKSFDITPVKEDRTRLTAKMVIDLYLSAKEYER